MRKIKWIVTTGGATSEYSGEFEVDDNATDEEIEEMAKDEAFNCVDWGWDEVKGNESNI